MSIYDSFVIYQDPELKYPLEAVSYDWDMDSGLLTIEPPLYGPAEYIVMDIDHPSPFLETNDESGWGNLPQLYLAAYADAKTGNPIEGNPLVTVLKVKEALKQAPQVTFSQDENGSARFSWKEVPGADEYFLFRIKDFGNGLDGYMNVVAATTDTQWTAEQTLSMDDSSALAINGMFKGYVMTDNDMIQNALFNLSDSAAYSILAEDDRFVLDGSVYDYEAPSDEKEYYRITNNYFTMDEITDILAEKLHSEGNAVLRTDYDLDDETFNRIAQETANQAHTHLSGFHWMGVIHLEQK